MKAKLLWATIGLLFTFNLIACRPPDPVQQPLEPTVELLPINNPTLEYSVTQEKQDDQEITFVGKPYEIPVDNCDGARDSTKIEERTQSYITDLNVDISNTLAAEFEGNVAVAKAVLRDEIEIAVGVRIGAQLQAMSAVEIVTPAGKKSVTTLQWKENWVQGTVEIKRPDGTYVDVLPFAVLNALTLEQLGSEVIDCDSGAVTTTGPSLQISEPEIPQIPPTPIPVLIGTIAVPAYSTEGIKFTVTQSGQYIFRYAGGAYSVYPLDGIPEGQSTWLTAVRIFKNRPIEWNGVGITKGDYSAADYFYFPSEGAAVERAKGFELPLSLKKGDYLILATVDELDRYWDNPGEVSFEVLFSPEG